MFPQTVMIMLCDANSSSQEGTEYIYYMKDLKAPRKRER